MIREVERRLADANLPSYAWYDTLWGLESGPGGTRRMHELADTLVIERYNLTRLVDRLEQEGLVTRSRSATDGRAAYASITREGRVLRKKMWKVYQSTITELFLNQFSASEQQALAEGLDRTFETVRASRDSAVA
ncbi:MarR family transcriptional regulator [Bordetella tumulicola]